MDTSRELRDKLVRKLKLKKYSDVGVGLWGLRRERLRRELYLQ